LSSRANPRRVLPVLLPNSRQSSSPSVQQAITSSGSHPLRTRGLSYSEVGRCSYLAPGDTLVSTGPLRCVDAWLCLHSLWRTRSVQSAGTWTSPQRRGPVGVPLPDPVPAGVGASATSTASPPSDPGPASAPASSPRPREADTPRLAPALNNGSGSPRLDPVRPVPGPRRAVPDAPSRPRRQNGSGWPSPGRRALRADALEQALAAFLGIALCETSTAMTAADAAAGSGSAGAAGSPHVGLRLR